MRDARINLSRIYSGRSVDDDGEGKQAGQAGQPGQKEVKRIFKLV